MQSTWLYLAINIFSVLGPLALSFDKKVAFYKEWKYLLPAIGIVGFVFIIWDIVFTLNGVWSFNSKYITGLYIMRLPVEEALFFLTIPYACLFIYACLNAYRPVLAAPRLSRGLLQLIVLVSLAIAVFSWGKLYTVVAFGFLAVGAQAVLLFDKTTWLPAFFRSYAVALLPFYIVNGILTAIPVVMYNNRQNLAIRVYTIPVEDHFYLMALLLLTTWLYERFKAGHRHA